MPIPADYEERVYAGVLGKIIGVYLGRPFEGWSCESLTARFGEIWYYVHEQLGAPLIVTDDDISGTFTFLRALADYGCRKDLTPRQIGQTWLNYIIQNRTILWWGGMGTSTENTAYLRLKAGIPAPESGSIALNGKTVAEQIGAQIFIDGWGMVAPGDPELAADLARRAASVSHDGEAIYGAQVVAALEAAAFQEPDLGRLLDIATSLIPHSSLIYRMIADLREWRESETDWRAAREKLAENYGYDRYGGGCHMVPNHGVIILALLYGDDSFQKSLMVANTAGWDTDCNSGNVGCLMGIKNGLRGIDSGPDWRGPVADRIYLPTADGGRCITDAAREALEIAGLGRSLAGESPKPSKARFHFSLPGSVQGFRLEDSPECRGAGSVSNTEMESGQRVLEIAYHALARGRACRVATPTFIPPNDANSGGYSLIASPTLYPGQTLRARVRSAHWSMGPIHVNLHLRCYGSKDSPQILRGPVRAVPTSGFLDLEWKVPDTGGSPIFEVGVEITAVSGSEGFLHLEYLTWEGVPEIVFGRPAGGGEMWKRAWVPGTTHFRSHGPEQPFIVIQDEGTGILSQGTREWTDYKVSTKLTPRLAGRVGLAARVQGQRRAVALLLTPGRAQILQLLDGEQTLVEQPFEWEIGASYDFTLNVQGLQITGAIAGGPTLTALCDPALNSGAIGLFCTEGRVDASPIAVRPTS